MKLKVAVGKKEYFPGIDQIKYEGPESKNPLAFKWYDPEKVVAGKSLRDHLRFSTAYWHSFCNTGNDPFGPGTKDFKWNESDNPLKRARSKMDAAFEFMTKVGTPFYCFHDFDIVDEGDSLKESDKRLSALVDYAKEKQAASGARLLWGTSNLFSNPRYMNGAASNPDFNVIAFAGSQVKRTLDATIELGGSNYVFWGGREGYFSLLNTEMNREKEHIATFFKMARD